MNAIQKEYAVKELKNEIKENLKRKFYKFFFVIKALVTLLLFILFEYLIIAHKMPVDLHYIFLQVTMNDNSTYSYRCKFCLYCTGYKISVLRQY